MNLLQNRTLKNGCYGKFYVIIMVNFMLLLLLYFTTPEGSSCLLWPAQQERSSPVTEFPAVLAFSKLGPQTDLLPFYTFTFELRFRHVL